MANGYDLGATPPPPAETVAQLQRGAVPGQGGGAMGGLFANAANQLSMQGQAELSANIARVEPLLTELARQAPGLAPDVNNLLTRLRGKSSAESEMAPELPPPTPAAPAGAATA